MDQEQLEKAQSFARQYRYTRSAERRLEQDVQRLNQRVAQLDQEAFNEYVRLTKED